MSEPNKEQVVDKISTTLKVGLDEAHIIYGRQVQGIVEQVQAVNSSLSLSELELNAETSLYNIYFPPIHEVNMSSKRSQVIKGCLVYMLLERNAGRTKVFPKNAARYLYDSGYRKTKLDKPDPKSVGDALGMEGLRLKKQSDGSYPIPKSPSDFILDSNQSSSNLNPSDYMLEGLFKKYGINSALFLMKAQD